MENIQALLAQRAEIDRKIAEAQRSQRADAIAQIRSLMSQHGLTAADVSGKSATRKSGKSTGKVAPKYRDKTTGDTWSGRGLQPKWLKAAITQGAKLTDFAI